MVTEEVANHCLLCKNIITLHCIVYHIIHKWRKILLEPRSMRVLSLIVWSEPELDCSPASIPCWSLFTLFYLGRLRVPLLLGNAYEGEGAKMDIIASIIFIVHF